MVAVLTHVLLRILPFRTRRVLCRASVNLASTSMFFANFQPCFKTSSSLHGANLPYLYRQADVIPLSCLETRTSCRASMSLPTVSHLLLSLLILSAVSGPWQFDCWSYEACSQYPHTISDFLGISYAFLHAAVFVFPRHSSAIDLLLQFPCSSASAINPVSVQFAFRDAGRSSFMMESWYANCPIITPNVGPLFVHTPSCQTGILT
jgi:hypothetical protein